MKETTLEITNGAVQSPIWQNDPRGKNWIAIVTDKGGKTLDRVFLPRAGANRFLCAAVCAHDILEIAGDLQLSRTRSRLRQYWIVGDVLDDGLALFSPNTAEFFDVESLRSELFDPD